MVRARSHRQSDEPLHHPEVCALPPLPSVPSRFAGPGPRASSARQHGGIHCWGGDEVGTVWAWGGPAGLI
eukprot:5558353-Alexandrium_andersonii.AAC.1